jgi:hypothetical protein
MRKSGGIVYLGPVDGCVGPQDRLQDSVALRFRKGNQVQDDDAEIPCGKPTNFRPIPDCPQVKSTLQVFTY